MLEGRDVGVTQAVGSGPQRSSYTVGVPVLTAGFSAGPEEAQMSFCLVLFIYFNFMRNSHNLKYPPF